MRLLVITVLLLTVMAASKKGKLSRSHPHLKTSPNMIHIDNKEYKKTHTQMKYDVDSFTSPRTQQLKTAQTRQDSSLQRAILHSQNAAAFVQVTQDENILMNNNQEDLSSEMMTEQQIQQALLTSEDFNNVPDIQMTAESNYSGPSVSDDDVNESYYIPVITEGDGSLEEVENSDVEPQQNPDIEMPSLDESSSSFLQ